MIQLAVIRIITQFDLVYVLLPKLALGSGKASACRRVIPNFKFEHKHIEVDHTSSILVMQFLMIFYPMVHHMLGNIEW